MVSKNECVVVHTLQGNRELHQCLGTARVDGQISVDDDTVLRDGCHVSHTSAERMGRDLLSICLGVTMA